MRCMTAGGIAVAFVLAGCASAPPATPPVQQSANADGVKVVSVAPASAVCSQPRCPTLAAYWSSDRAGLVVLTVGLPYQSVEVTGADFHFGNSAVVRLRLRSSASAPALGYPASAFDAPLNLVDALAYKPNGWMRVHTADGRWVDEVLMNGEDRAPASATMAQFLSVVESARGEPVRGESYRGGVLDLLD